MISGMSPRSGRKKMGKRKGGTSKKREKNKVRRVGHDDRYVLIMEFKLGDLKSPQQLGIV